MLKRKGKFGGFNLEKTPMSCKCRTAAEKRKIFGKAIDKRAKVW